MQIDSRAVKIKMAEKGIDSQAELARKLGVHKQSLTNWFKGKNKPTLDNVQELANMLGCKIEDITFLVAPEPTALLPQTEILH